MKYRKKPVVIEAIQWTGDNKCLEVIRRFMKPNPPARGTEAHPDCLLIHTLEGTHRANVGDWIIRGIKGEFYPCKPDIFEQTYEKDITDSKISSMDEPRDFDIFQLEFKRWQVRFGLTGYKVYLKEEMIDSAFASMIVSQSDMVATVSFNNRLRKKDKPYRDAGRSAKHEALHLLIYRLEGAGRYRYSSENEVSDASEELVVRLEGLIS